MDDAQRFKLLNDLFDRAHDLSPAEAEAMLAAIGDASLRTELRQMLELDREGTPEVRTLIDISSVIDAPEEESEVEVDVPERIGGYEVLGMVGYGASGVVLKARQSATERIVAVKVLGSGAWNPAALTRFRREIRLLSRLEHPHIARVYDAGTDTASLPVRPFFVMEFVDGVPLNVWARGASGGVGAGSGKSGGEVRGARRSVREVVEAFLDIADAIGYAHAAGVVHRDLKPGNIFVTAEHSVKVLDFGVSGTLSRAPTTEGERTHEPMMTMSLPGVSVGDSLVGTLPYMSPEQFDGTHAVDARSDLYAMGVLLYECLTGQLPYSVERRTIPEAAAIIRDEIPSTISRVDRALRGDVEIIVARLLEKDPAQRYQTAGELAEDLKRFLDGRPTRARPVSRVERARRFTRRYHVLIVATALAFATLVGFLWYAVHLWQVAESRSRELASALEVTKRADYRRAIRDAEASLESGSPRDTRRALSSVPLELRGWEWRYLANRAGAESRVLSLPALPLTVACRGGVVLVGDLSGHVYAIHGVSGAPELVAQRGVPARDLALSPDGTQFVVAETSESTMLIQSTKTGEVVRILAADLGPPTSVAWSDDGRWLAYATFHGRAAVLDLQTGSEVQRVGPAISEMPDPADVRFRDGMVRFFPACDGFIVAERLDHRATIVPRLGAQPLLVETAGSAVECIGATRSSEGPLALIGDFDGRVHCFEADDGRLVRTIAAHRGALRTLTDGPGEYRFTTGAVDGTIHIYDANRGTPVGDAFGAELHVRGVAHEQNVGQLIAVGDDRSMRMWSVARHVLEPVLRGHRAWVYSIAFASDGSLASGGGEVPRNDGRLLRWDLASRESSDAVKLGSEAALEIVWDVAADPKVEGGWIAAAGARVWFRQGDALDSFSVPSSVFAVAPVAGGDAIALLRFESAQVEIYSREGKLLTSVPCRGAGDGALATDHLGETLFVGDGSTVACYGVRRGVDAAEIQLTRSWELWTGTTVTSLSSTPDGRLVAVGCKGGDALLVENAANVAEEPSDAGVGNAPLSVVWRTRANPGDSVRVAISPDGARVVTGGTGPAVRVWDAADGEPLLSLSGHGDTILDVQFSFDGRTLATSSMDGTIRLWLASDELMDAAPLWEASGEGSGEGSGKDRGKDRGRIGEERGEVRRITPVWAC
jgi:serine/threonine protein kinase/WD40 repeat protein